MFLMWFLFAFRMDLVWWRGFGSGSAWLGMVLVCFGLGLAGSWLGW
jgi:hypothetical protein